MQTPLACIVCGNSLSLARDGLSTYSWRCPNNCISPLDTGVPSIEPIDDLEPDESGNVEFNASHFFPPLTNSRIATAKVFMAQILDHFITCSWGGCYNNLYVNVIVPLLDAPEIVDYVLRTNVVRERSGTLVGKTGAKIYPELRSRLQGVKSARIRAYLIDTFGGDRI